MASTTFSISDTVSQGSLSQRDQREVNTVELSAQFNPVQDFAEASLYNNRGEFISTTRVNIGINPPSAPKDPSQVNEERDLASSTVSIDPTPLLNSIPDPLKEGARAVYSFFRPILSNFKLEELSYDRTEGKLKSIGFDRTQSSINLLISLVKDATYYGKIGIDHAEGEYTPIINVVDDGEYLYLKLYRPLPESVNLGDSISINQEVADPVTVTFNFTPDEPEVAPTPFLRTANFNIKLDDSSAVSTEYINYDELYSLPVTNSYNRIFSEVEKTGVELSVDYTNFENFVHFSSAKERLANFKYKLDLYDQYRNERAIAASLSNASNAITSSNLYYDNLIKGVVSKFDGYERYLFYESSSKAWPKASSNTPYINVSSSDAAATTWYAAEYASASLYDELNESNLEYTVPEFIRQDDSNAPYSLFLNMIGQHFDELWISAKGITDKYDADNRLDYGISKELIEKTLQSFGVKLYSSNFATDSLLNLYTGQWYSTGSEDINTFVTASNDPSPSNDIIKETYKRIYHNLPYLLKTKGTERGLRALINCFGIPSGSLTITESGGYTVGGYYYNRASTVDKIRLDNTGSLVSGSTLSLYTSIQKEDNKYTQDLHQIDISFSPTTQLNSEIEDLVVANTPAGFNIDDYIGDPTVLNSGSYASLNAFASSNMSTVERYDVFDFIRLIKFFDNQLFKMIKDFVPARTETTTGITIKPHILNRSKIKSPVVDWSQPEYTGSIDTAFISGSSAGIFDNLSTTYSASLLTPSGSILRIYDDQAAKINGELGGTVLDMYSGSLNEANPLKKPAKILPRYVASGSSSNNNPAQGTFNWQAELEPAQLDPDYQIKYLYINEVDANGENIENALGNLRPGDKITFSVKYQSVIP
jgi:hypothetical protein